MSNVQEYLIAYFADLANRVNKNPHLLTGMENGVGGGRSIMVVLEDQNAASGLLLDAQGAVRIVDPGSVNPTLIVIT